jgi:hypothetical protein
VGKYRKNNNRNPGEKPGFIPPKNGLFGDKAAPTNAFLLQFKFRHFFLVRLFQ